MQKSYQANATKTVRTMNRNYSTYRTPACNKVLPKWRLKCYYEIFVQNSTVVILLNFSANNPPLRQYPNRCAKVFATLRLLHIVRRITSDDAFRLATLDLQHINGFAKLLHLQTSFAVRNFANPPHVVCYFRATETEKKKF
jgi:hypothetical protein